MLKKLAAVVALMLGVVGLSAPAQAYPLGTDFSVESNYSQVDPGKVIRVTAYNAAPGCYVNFVAYFDGKKGSSVSVLANDSGYAYTSVRSSKPAHVVVNAGYNCNGDSESDSVGFTFGRESKLTASLAASSNVLTVSGNFTNEAATVGISGATGTATFYAPNGTKIGNTRFMSGTAGYYSSSVSVKSPAAGSYRVDVSFGFKTPYFGQSASASNSFSLVFSVPGGSGKAVGKSKSANHRVY